MGNRTNTSLPRLHGAVGLMAVAVIVFIVVASLYAVSSGVSSNPTKKTIMTSTTVKGVVTTTTTTTSHVSAGVKVGSTALMKDIYGNPYEVSTERKFLQFTALDTVSLRTPDGRDAVLYDSVAGANGEISELFSFTVVGVDSATLVDYNMQWELEGSILTLVSNSTARSILVSSEVRLPMLKVTGSQIYEKLKLFGESSKTVVFKVDLSLTFTKKSGVEMRSLSYQGAKLQATFTASKQVVPTEIKATNLPLYDLGIFIQVSTPQGSSIPHLIATGLYLYDPTSESGALYNPVSGLQLKVQYGYRLTEQSTLTVSSIKLYNAVKTAKGSIISQPSLAFTDTRVVTLQPYIPSPGGGGSILGSAVLVSVEDVKGSSIVGFVTVSSDGGEAKDEATGRPVKLKPVKGIPMALYSLELLPVGNRVKWLSFETSTEQVSGWKVS